MKLLTVVPVVKGIFQENLSYFTSKNIDVGSLVSVQVRKKTLPAIVLSSQEIKEIKTKIRRADFSLKSIKGVLSSPFLMPEFVDACKEMADYFVSPLGTVIKDFVPQAILENNSEISTTNEKDDGVMENKRFEIALLQDEKEERLQNYKSIIREEFAKNKSVFFCLPTISEIEKIALELQKGIEKYTVILHSGMTTKKIKETWNAILKESHPLLIIGTKSFLSIPKKDIGVIIVDQESSPFYKNQTRPYVDARKAAEIIGTKLKIKIIFGDNLIRTETYHRYKPSFIPRVLSEANQIIIDTKKKEFEVISPELKKIIGEAYTNNEKTVLFINKRGYSPVTVCNDCLRVVLCNKCEAPLIIHEGNSKEKKAEFLCHKCLSKSVAPEKCPYCKSWKLKELGVGIQKTTELITELFPKIKIFAMDSDNIKNKKQGDIVINNFLNTPGSILIATEILFSYLNQTVENVAVVTIDNLFALPDFRINEKIFQTLIKLKSLAKKTFLIQTRIPEQKIFDDAIRGNFSNFYRTELESRKQFQYPPFKLLIKLSVSEKNKLKLNKEIDDLKNKFKKWNPVSYEAFIPKIKNVYTSHILLKTEPETWPNEQSELRQILSSVSLYCKINVEPESLL